MSSAFSDKPDGSVFCEPIPILPRPGDALTISTGTNAIRGWGAPAPMLNNKRRSSNAQSVFFTHPASAPAALIASTGFRRKISAEQAPFP